MSSLSYTLFRAALGVTQGKRYRALMEGAKTPREVQDALLQSILESNAGTVFGEAHGFSAIGSAEAYREAVAVQTYEDLRPLIERQELTGERCLTQAKPVYYHRTSGTIGEPKNIPVTAAGLRQMKLDQKLSAYVWSRGQGILEGKLFAIGGSAVEGHMEGGTPFGSASGLLYRSQSRFVRSRYVLPADLSDVEDYESRYFAMAVYGLGEPDVSSMATANPSTFLRLLSVVNQNADAILDAVETGRVPDEALSARLKPRPWRADDLRERLAEAGRLTYADIWPNLKGVVTWTGGSCGIALGSLSGLLPDSAAIIEWGYSSSEFRGTLNVDVRKNACLPTLFNTFFEFVERGAWEEATGEFLGLHELRDGHEYYVFVTTGDGLYRYDINDIVRVHGWIHATPMLEFVQKGKGVTNITGEKLTESQVLTAVTSTFSQLRATPGFFIAVANEAASSYTIFMEPPSSEVDGDDLAVEVDRHLGIMNVEYHSKRRSGRLGPLQVRWLPAGTGDLYRASCVAAGQRDAQFKYLHLQYARDCAYDFESVAELL